eukprot:TRINITY_DN2663_c0_g1_i2.p1 TRINITY_DN2663_c0_g1~~TRINITY_DN2663_c0_g1_i2.p1  ORF type:complete len:756 (-),score=182.84 TRINITY_DN2663_c0_g1_i2:466-2733(-)
MIQSPIPVPINGNGSVAGLTRSKPAPKASQYQNSVKSTLKSLPTLDLKKCTRQDVLDYFNNGWDLFETLKAACLDDDTFYLAPDKLRRPLIFYLGHTACLFVNKLVAANLMDRVNPHFESLFAVGVDEMSWDDMDEDRYVWPPMNEVWEFRKNVHKQIVDIITDPARMQIPVPEGINCWDHPLWALAMGFEHERIHFETSSVLLRQLPAELTVRPPGWKYAPLQAPEHVPISQTFLDVPGRRVTIGKSFEDPTYGWDNEFGQRTEDVEDFKASKYLITNREFFGFVAAGGYTNESLWDEEGWKWRCYRKATRPTFWVEVDPEAAASDSNSPPPSPSPVHTGPSFARARRLSMTSARQFKYRAMWHEMEMPWDWPVEVNYLEARAYCRWLGPNYRLPSEAEWHCIRGDTPVLMPRGTANLEMEFGSPSPVNYFPPNELGFHDARGNVWQWSEEHAHALEGFRVHPLYDDFSTPCFDNRHNMILGGSWVSTGDEATKFARFHFRRHFFQHAGFRVVQSNKAVHHEDANEADALVNAHMAFFYAPTDEYFPYDLDISAVREYPARIAKESIRIARQCSAPMSRALDFGCSVGRTSFELTRGYDKVVGIDTTARFIAVCHSMRSGGNMKYKRTDQDGTEAILLATVPDDIPEPDRLRTEFWQGNLRNLSIHYGTFDLVLISDPLLHVVDPLSVIEHVSQFVNPGGVLIISTTANLLDGDKKPVLPGFAPVETRNLGLLVRETTSKFHLGVAHLSAWCRG